DANAVRAFLLGTDQEAGAIGGIPPRKTQGRIDDVKLPARTEHDRAGPQFARAQALDCPESVQFSLAGRDAKRAPVDENTVAVIDGARRVLRLSRCKIGENRHRPDEEERERRCRSASHCLVLLSKNYTGGNEQDGCPLSGYRWRGDTLSRRSPALMENLRAMPRQIATNPTGILLSNLR